MEGVVVWVVPGSRGGLLASRGELHASRVRSRGLVCVQRRGGEHGLGGLGAERQGGARGGEQRATDGTQL